MTAHRLGEQIEAGVIRVSRAKWDLRRVYITDPMLERLRKAVADLTLDKVILTEAARGRASQAPPVAEPASRTCER